MAKRNKKIKNKKQPITQEAKEPKEQESFFLKIWSNTVYRLLLKFTGVIALFYLAWASRFFQETVVFPIAKLYAAAAGLCLKVMGYSIQVSEDVIGSEAFSISIRNGCDGIEGLMILLTAILIFPTSLKDKLWGLVCGSLFLIGLNLFRIISLYWFGVHIPSLFELMHVSVWQVLFILLSLITLFYWMNWTSKKSSLTW